jgi:hypothetical protein
MSSCDEWVVVYVHNETWIMPLGLFVQTFPDTLFPPKVSGFEEAVRDSALLGEPIYIVEGG